MVYGLNGLEEQRQTSKLEFKEHAAFDNALICKN